jgi:hypothetical protein
VSIQNHTRVIQNLRRHFRYPSNYLQEIEDEHIIIRENIYSINVWIFIVHGEMEHLLFDFKPACFIRTDQLALKI